ncbi:hypothetical protein BGZ83_000441 [Gryganskiella cystojenkinii]|nr:hypothetical protein BGZ83_000441 [Gryganskiella cystojenkinii]
MNDVYEHSDNKAEVHDPEKASEQPEYKEELKEKDIDLEEEEVENSPIEAVRLVVPITDDPTLHVLTFRFWILSFFFAVLAATVNQYYIFRTTSGSFSIYFVNLATFAMGRALARVLPQKSITVFGYSLSLNPGPFNIKEHCLIGVTVSTASYTAYAIDILAVTDLFLGYRINALGSLLLIFTTQCLGYGMAGTLRKYLIYPAEMVWWDNLVQVVFYNAMHNTDEFKSRRMIRGWSYMKYFWVFCAGMFVYEFIPQFLAPMVLYIDWICWINPFNMDFWALFSSYNGAGILSISLDWNSIGGATLWLPLATQLCQVFGVVLSYWIILPSIWLTNTLGAKTFGKPLSASLFHLDGTPFHVSAYLNPDYTLNETKYEESQPVTMVPMYALNFFWSFVALGACLTHIGVFHGREIVANWRAAVGTHKVDVHTKMMKAYPEVPQWWYASFYVVMAALSIVCCHVYNLQLPWWGLLVALAMGWIMTFPLCALYAITGAGPGLNVLTELVCGYMLPGRAIANMVFKCYGYMAMNQCQNMLIDLKLGHYMKIPPRAMFLAQFWGTILGGLLNYAIMIVIIDAHRGALDMTAPDPSGLWNGFGLQIFWGSALIFGALGPRRMFSSSGNYGFIFYGLLLGAALPPILWLLSKKFPNIKWQKVNIAIIAGGMSAFANGQTTGIVTGTITCVIFQYYIFRYHKHWWQKYVFILAAALDTGAAFTGLAIFIFLGGGISPKLSVTVPSWWANHYNATDEDYPNSPYLAIDRCGAAHGAWTGGMLKE